MKKVLVVLLRKDSVDTVTGTVSSLFDMIWKVESKYECTAALRRRLNYYTDSGRVGPALGSDVIVWQRLMSQ